MCGITGYLAYGDKIPKDPILQLNAMLKEIEHRGPDDFGLSIWHENDRQYNFSPKLQCNAAIVKDSCLAFGHRRLSIIDISDAGHQPMYSNDGELAIVFNGEIYNYLELRQELLNDYVWKTHTDTEVILASYLKWGKEMLQHFDGMFAFVILDIKKNILFGARDVAGIKPFYYKCEKNLFAFASEPKALRCLGSSDYSFNKTYLSEFLLLGLSDHDEGTMLNNINQLKGGHYLILDIKSNTKTIASYNKIPSNHHIYDGASFINSLEIAVNRQLRADVPIGTSLSGGIDSSIIAAIAAKVLGEKRYLYSALTFTHPGFPDDESILAKKVALFSGLKWIPVQPEIGLMNNELDAMIINMGEPFSSLSMFAQYKVMEKAQKLGIKVMLDGQGGDELYLGYPRMTQRVMFKYLQQLNVSKFIKEIRGLKENLSVSYTRSILSNIYFNSKLLASGIRLKAVSRYVNVDYIKNVREDTISDFYANKSLELKQQDELFKYCLPRLLRYADRNSMAFSVESRVPHLSNIMIDIALQMSPYQKVHDGWSKHILRSNMTGRVPEEILWNKVKKGFAVPQEYWLNHLNSKILEWIDAIPAGSQFNKENLFYDLNNKNFRKDMWPVISTIGLFHLSDIRLF